MPCLFAILAWMSRSATVRVNTRAREGPAIQKAGSSLFRLGI